MALVSIVISAYNVEKYIARCLDSIRKQTFSDIEIIVVDDGSKDKTGVICDKYKKFDDRIAIYHQTNNGVSSARNIGIEYATGKYLIFIDADDWLDYDMIEFMVHGIESSNADIFACGYYINDEPYLYKDKDYKNTIVSRDFIQLCLKKSTVILGTTLWNKILKKDIINRMMELFDENLTLGEDMDFLIRYLLFCNLGSYSLIPKYHYFKRHDSAVASVNERSLSVITAHKKLYKYFLEDKQIKGLLLNRLADSAYTLLHMAKNAGINNKQIVYRLQKTLKEIPYNYYVKDMTFKNRLSYIMLVSSYITYILYELITRGNINEKNRNSHNL